MRAWILGCLSLALLVGCSPQAMIERISTPNERALSMQIAVAVQRGDTATIWNRGTPGLQDHLSRETVARMHALAPQEKPVLLDVKSMWQSADGVTTQWKQFTYQTGSEKRWAAIQVVLREGNGKTTVDSVFIQPFDRAPSSLGAFTLQGKSALHYAWLAAMAAAVITSIVAFILVLRTGALRFKWLWAFGVLFSFVSFAINWTNGSWVIRPISLLLLGASGMRAGFMDPWILQFAIPIPAIVFLILRSIGKLPIRTSRDHGLGGEVPAESRSHGEP